MLFNSYGFIFAFLPVCLFGYVLATRLLGNRAARTWLLLCSFVFYGMWELSYLLVLIASIGFNYGAARGLEATVPGSASRRALLSLGVIVNLALLCWFKYAAFLAWTALGVRSAYFDALAVALPLGISFFTFQQIAYLVDVATKNTKVDNLRDYALFVTFFPQLIAGPIVHHAEMMPQFAGRGSVPDWGERIARGSAFFIIGLFKKVVIADNLAPFASSAFAQASSGTLSAWDAWSGALAYSFQIYFDFSGYSDMAVGLALLFGIRLPYNFNSPYKSMNIIDFWRRWHMTLSRFLRDYVYIPLGGNRLGPERRYLNLGATMLIGGLWHGANWTFVVWGGLHGLMLAANHMWSGMRLSKIARFPMAAAMTFLLVTIAWVFFRAENLTDAWAFLQAMAGANGTGDFSKVVPVLAAAWLLLYFVPNSQELVDGAVGGEQARNWRVRWRPNAAWATGMAALMLFTLSQLSSVSQFLYFNF